MARFLTLTLTLFAIFLSIVNHVSASPSKRPGFNGVGYRINPEFIASNAWKLRWHDKILLSPSDNWKIISSYMSLTDIKLLTMISAYNQDKSSAAPESES